VDRVVLGRNAKRVGRVAYERGLLEADDGVRSRDPRLGKSVSVTWIGLSASLSEIATSGTRWNRPGEGGDDRRATGARGLCLQGIRHERAVPSPPA
jgi:hypothetical protein